MLNVNWPRRGGKDELIPLGNGNSEEKDLHDPPDHHQVAGQIVVSLETFHEHSREYHKGNVYCRKPDTWSLHNYKHTTHKIVQPINHSMMF